MGTGLSSSCSTSSPAPLNAPGKAMNDGPSAWVPVTLMGDPGGIPGLGSAWLNLAIAACGGESEGRS